MSHPVDYKVRIIILSYYFVRGVVSWYRNAEVSTANLPGVLVEESTESSQTDGIGMT